MYCHCDANHDKTNPTQVFLDTEELISRIVAIKHEQAQKTRDPAAAAVEELEVEAPQREA